MAAAQESAAQATPEGSSLSADVASSTSARLPQASGGSLRGGSKYPNRKSRSWSRAESRASEDKPGTVNAGRKRACPRIGPGQRARCHTENVERSSDQMVTEQSASVENVSLSHCFRSSFSGSGRQVKTHSSSMPDIHERRGAERTDKVLSQTEADIVDHVIGDELHGKSSCGHSAETWTVGIEQASDAVTGKVSCPNRICPGEPQSERTDIDDHNEAGGLRAADHLKQSTMTKLGKRESSCSSIWCSSASSISSSYSLAEGRSVGSEQASRCADPSLSNGRSPNPDATDLPEGSGDVLDTTAAPALRQHIEHLRCHLNDLQDANDSTINELTKADEEISQLRGEIAELRAKHAEELQLAKQESDYFKNKFNRLCSAASQNTVKDDTADLLEQIQQLRNESRKLREMNHRLDEENHRLKEILWDLKRQDRRFPRKQFKGKIANAESTIKGDRTISGTKAQRCAKESETMLQKMSSLPARLHCISPSSLIGFEYLNIEDEIGPIKSDENRMTFDRRLGSHDDECTERSASSCSSASIDSDNTEALLASCNDVTDGQLINTNVHRDAGSLLDLDGLSEDDTSLVNRSNPRQQFQHVHCSSSIHCKPITSPSGFSSSSSCLNRQKTSRSLVDNIVLPRRPFAPRSITDLKIGHLVKFSRPAGKIGKGVVKYLGNLPGRQEAYLGVELEGTEVGQHNGTFEGVRYFICKMNKGVFVNFSKVIMAWE